MKKFKKALAMILAMAMVLGMSMTVLADENDTTTPAGTIVVKGLTKGESTTVRAYKVVEWSQTESTWKAVEGVPADAVVIEKGQPITIVADMSIEGLGEGIPADVNPTTTGEATFSDLEIGAYVIVASSGENGTTAYKRMVASTYKYNDKGLMVLGGETVYAKAGTYKITKAFAAEGNTATTFIKRGETVKYDITVPFPSFDKETEAEDKVFTITDTPSGLSIQNIQVSVGENEVIAGDDTYTVGRLPAAQNEAVTITFGKNYIGNTNAHAGETVTVTVTALAGDLPADGKYSNIATSNKAGNPSDPVTSETGSMTITKKALGSNQNLAGAIFNISLGGETLQFVGENGVYKLALPNEEGADAAVEVNADGELVLNGLGAGTYTITETQAPDGYSINDQIPVKTISVDAENGKDNAKNIAFDVEDSRLGSLPSTGGIGTTIFTIGGCLIMIIAAGLFFASRRKSAK